MGLEGHRLFGCMCYSEDFGLPTKETESHWRWLPDQAFVFMTVEFSLVIDY